MHDDLDVTRRDPLTHLPRRNSQPTITASSHRTRGVRRRRLRMGRARVATSVRGHGCAFTTTTRGRGSCKTSSHARSPARNVVGSPPRSGWCDRMKARRDERAHSFSLVTSAIMSPHPSDARARHCCRTQADDASLR
jgi:hypothetical protein